MGQQVLFMNKYEVFDLEPQEVYHAQPMIDRSIPSKARIILSSGLDPVKASFEMTRMWRGYYFMEGVKKEGIFLSDDLTIRVTND